MAVPLCSQAFDRIQVQAVHDSGSRLIRAHMSMILTDLSPETESLHLRLLANARCPDGDGEACGFMFDSLLVNGADRLNESEINGTDLKLPLPYESLTDKEVALDVYYTLHMPSLSLRFGYGDERVLLEGWIPVPAPRDDTGWLNIDYSNDLAEPVGDYYEFDITFTAPTEYDIIAPNTTPVSADDSVQTVNIHVPHAGHAAIVLGKRFEHRDTTITVVDHEVTLRTYYRPRAAFAIDSIQVWSAFALNYMSEVVGEAYPHDEFVTVVGGLYGGGGLEQPQMTWLSPVLRNQTLPYVKLVTVHEVIHQWFFYLIPSNQALHPWMDEAITDYFSARVLAAMTPEGRGDMLHALGLQLDYTALHRSLSATFFPRKSILAPADSYGGADYYGAMYCKGGEIMATFDNLMEEQGNDFWRAYYAAHKYRRPTDSAFCDMAQTYLPGDHPDRCRTLLAAMIRPDYSFDQVETERDGDSITTTFTILSKAPIDFPIDFRITHRDGSVLDTTLRLKPGVARVERTTTEQVVLAELDPATKIIIDADRVNNSWSRDRINSADYRLFSALTFLIESAYSIAWGW